MTKQHKNFKDITGQRFGRLTVLEFVERRGRFPYWKCVCDCGNVVLRSGYSMLQGNTKSCGCLARENRKKANHKKYKYANAKLQTIWRAMHHRCENETDIGYHRYGGRGIYVCDEWKDADVFAQWALAYGYKEGYSIERIDNDGPYTPENCCFKTKKEQANNRRTNVFIEYNGQRKTIAEWSEITGIRYTTLRRRYFKNWRVEDIFNIPVSLNNNNINRRNVVKENEHGNCIT